MFRCSECNKEFNIKPDYCDCGNDVFIEIEAEQKKEKPKPQITKKSFEERYPGIVNLKNSFDPISVGIFCVCIILSILSLIFIGRGDETAEQQEETPAIIKTTSTLNVDDFWDDRPAKVETTQPVVVQKPINVVVQTKNQMSTPKLKTPVAQTKKQIAKTPQTTKKPVTQTTKKPTTQTTKTPVAQAPKTTSSSQTTIQVPKTNNNSSAKIQTSKIQVQEKKNTQKPTQTDLAELKKYKNALRNKIYSYIDFASIIGDGTCVVTFSVNSEGRLINRNFAQKSSSVMLNDAVYNAMLNVPTYKQPPSAYKGETMKFTVKFFSGEYEVSLN